jgi:hypothetical protein
VKRCKPLCSSFFFFYKEYTTIRRSILQDEHPILHINNLTLDIIAMIIYIRQRQDKTSTPFSENPC